MLAVARFSAIFDTYKAALQNADVASYSAIDVEAKSYGGLVKAVIIYPHNETKIELVCAKDYEELTFLYGGWDNVSIYEQQQIVVRTHPTPRTQTIEKYTVLEKITGINAEKLKELFGIKMDCLFYDITSTYFEGNETDITTVGRAISRLKNEFSISDCLLIFDRGMVSEDNFVKDLEEGFSLYAVERILELYGKERKVVICYDTKKAASKKRNRAEELKRTYLYAIFHIY